METVEKVVSLKKPFGRDKTYLLFKNGFFFFRFANSGFGSKWCGLWDLDTKLLEYFAFKVGDEWLSRENIKNFDYNGTYARHIYKTKIGDVTEKIALGKSLVVELDLPKRADIQAKLAFNLRKRDENKHGRHYEMSGGAKQLTVKNDGLAKVNVAFTGKFEKAPEYETHLPGKYANEAGYDWQEDEQQCFVPGLFTSRAKTFKMKLSTGKPAGTVKEISKERRKFIRRKSTKLNMPADAAWNISTSVLAHYVNRRDGRNGFMAGFPYFNEFWTRDFLWMVPSLLHMGFEREVGAEMKSIAQGVAKLGDVPMILGSTAVCSDSTPLFLFSLDRYLRFSMKPFTPFRKSVEAVVKKGLDSKRGGLISHQPLYTWMDTLGREFAVEVQALWAKAFSIASRLLDKPELEDESEKLWDKIEDNYWNGDFYLDALRGPYEFTCNSLMPVILEGSRDERFLKTVGKMKDELMTDFGFRAVSNKEKSTPEKYHERVWGLSTHWGLKLLALHDKAKARELMSNYVKYMERGNIYGMPETITSQGEPKGASHQLWSVAFIPEIYDLMQGFSVGDNLTVPLQPGSFAAGAWRINVER